MSSDTISQDVLIQSRIELPETFQLGTKDLTELRNRVIALMRVETTEGLDRSPFALALQSLDDIIDMARIHRNKDEKAALDWLKDYLSNARTGLLKLMREQPLGRAKQEVKIPVGMEHLTSQSMEDLYERWASEPLADNEKTALAELKTLLGASGDVVRFCCMHNLGDPDRTALLQGALSDFCMHWNQELKPVIDGLCVLFPELAEMIKEALNRTKRRAALSTVRNSEQPFKNLIDFHQVALTANEAPL